MSCIQLKAILLLLKMVILISGIDEHVDVPLSDILT